MNRKKILENLKVILSITIDGKYYEYIFGIEKLLLPIMFGYDYIYDIDLPTTIIDFTHIVNFITNNSWLRNIKPSITYGMSDIKYDTNGYLYNIKSIGTLLYHYENVGLYDILRNIDINKIFGLINTLFYENIKIHEYVEKEMTDSNIEEYEEYYDEIAEMELLQLKCDEDVYKCSDGSHYITLSFEAFHEDKVNGPYNFLKKINNEFDGEINDKLINDINSLYFDKTMDCDKLLTTINYINELMINNELDNFKI